MTRTWHRPPRVLFVLEQSLGHAVHGRNLERVLEVNRDMAAEVIRVDQRIRAAPWMPSGLNWSLEASVAARRRLRAQTRKRAFDAAYIHTQVAALLSVGVMRSVPTVVSMDATPVNFDDVGEGYDHRRHSAALEEIKRIVNRRALRATAAIITWSNWAARSVVGDYGIDEAKVHVIHPGVDLAVFRPGLRRRSTDRPRILFVGRDFRRKGGYDLLEAVRSLDGRVELDIVTGDRSSVPSQPGVRVYSGLDHASTALPDLYRKADIFAVPSRGECYGLVYAEAHASGLPVVACKGGGIDDLVVDGRTGYLVSPRSPRELHDALCRLVDDPAMRIRMGARGLQHARRSHDARRNGQRIVDMLCDLSASGTHAPWARTA